MLLKNKREGAEEMGAFLKNPTFLAQLFVSRLLHMTY